MPQNSFRRGTNRGFTGAFDTRKFSLAVSSVDGWITTRYRNLEVCVMLLKNKVFVLLSLLFLALPLFGRSYSTNFASPPAPQNPISEGGNWINGKANGVNWNNVSTTAGFAFGTQTGFDNFADSTAILTGAWGPDQSAQGVIHIVQQDSGVTAEESEIRLRSWFTTTPCPGQSTGGCATGYEVNFSAVSGNNYVQIVRWNGPLGSFTLLDSRTATVSNGDTVKATISGNTITAYVNGVQILQVTDSTYNSTYCSSHTCNPGMGFYLQNGSGTGTNSHFGFSSFQATDGTTTTPTPPAAPSGLTAVPK